jgi:hypothetical protein
LIINKHQNIDRPLNHPNIDNYYFFHGKKEEGVDEEVHLRSSMEGNNMEVEQGKGIDLAEDNFDLDQMR